MCDLRRWAFAWCTLYRSYYAADSRLGSSVVNTLERDTKSLDQKTMSMTGDLNCEYCCTHECSGY